MSETVTIPPPPPRPPQEECCGRGCEPCIFDYHDRALERWAERVRRMGGDPEAILARSANGTSASSS